MNPTKRKPFNSLRRCCHLLPQPVFIIALTAPQKVGKNQGDDTN
jgi:hypothetical protein